MADITISVGRRTGLWALAGLVVLAGLGGGYYYMLGRPEYSLYQLDRSIQAHDLAGFNRYVDTAAVTNTLVDDMWSDVQAEMQKKQASEPQNQWSALGQNLATMIIEGLKPRVKEAAHAMVETQLERSMLHLPAPGEAAPEGNAPDLQLADLKVEGAVAEATVRVGARGDTLVFDMSQQPDRHWQIVKLRYDAIKKLEEAHPEGGR